MAGSMSKLRISSFEMLGWTDLDDPKAVPNVSKWIRTLSHDNYLFPEEKLSPEKPPNIVFMPEEDLLNKLIEYAAKHHGNTDNLLAKLSDHCPSMPEWMKEQRRLKEERLENERMLLVESGLEIYSSSYSSDD